MKSLLCSALLCWAISVAAQPPQPGFARKTKKAAPTAGLSQRLGAQPIPAPAQKASHSSLTALNPVRLNTQALRLHVVRSRANGLPIYIENRAALRPGTKQARLDASAAAFQFMGQVKGLLKMDNPEIGFKIKRTDTDELGQTHIRLTQTHQGIPVYGSELVAHLTNGTVTLLNGRYQLVNNVSTKPKLALQEATKRALQDVGKESVVRSFGSNLLKMKTSEGELCLYPVGQTMKLAYQLTIRPNMVERWQYIVDAQTGAVLDKFNNTCGLDGVVKASGKDLNGVTRSFQTYQEDKQYYLIDMSKSMFDLEATQESGQLVGAIQTLDANNTAPGNDDFSVKVISSATNKNWEAKAISAHFNSSTAYDYYEKVHKRKSLNGKGGTMIAVINIADEDGKGLDNAFWNGAFMGYGNGKIGFKPLAGGLDVAGHEMTHGVIENTAILEYKGQSGAINESMADVFGVLVDRDDWTLGEDVVLKSYFKSGAMRSMADPNQLGPKENGYQPKTMAQFVKTDDDNGGVHSNSGIPNYAFYLFASKVGKDKAEKVYYRALTNYLTRTSQFVDLRLAIIRSTEDLYGASGAEVKAATAAFDAVGITETTESPDEPETDLPASSGEDMILVYGVGDETLYTVPVAGDQFEAKVQAKLKHRPSVTDDGTVAYYVADDKRIWSVNLTGTPEPAPISQEAVWNNVAVSKDGTKVAALTDEKDGSIWVYSYELKKWSTFKLYNPTSAQGVKTGEVEYADSFEWDYSGENIIYDAYNKLNNLDGDPIDYWDVGIIHVWDTAKKKFGDGQIDKLFTGLDVGESIGNPSFSKNSPTILAFDYYNQNDETYYVLAVDLKTGDVAQVVENNDLGFPGYSRLDDRLVFNTLGKDKEAQVAMVALKSDKITPKGDPEVIYNNASWAVWYAPGERDIPTKTAQTITFTAIPDKTIKSAAFTLTATASSKLPVSFTLVSGPAKLAGNKVTLSGTAGTVVIRAMQEGNDKFAAATPVERTFKVTKSSGLAYMEPGADSELRVYPNPVSTTLTVELPADRQLDALILSTSNGATVVQQPAVTPTGKATLDTSQLTPGLYILTIQTPDGPIKQKIIKQ